MVTYYKFLKDLPYIDLRNTYLYFLALSYYIKSLKKELKKIFTVRVFIYSYRTKTYTILKTPMANKTWSKEQITIKYNMVISSVRGVASLIKLHYKLVFKILISLRKQLTEVETSSLFIKNIFISYKFIHKIVL